MHKIPSDSLKKLFLSLVFLMVCAFSFSQNSNNKSDFWNNVRFGGSIGFGLTNGGFNGSVAPSAIYQFNSQFALGTSLSLNYYRFDDSKFLAYGGSLLSLYNPIDFLQISAELEQLRVNRSLGTGTLKVEDNYWSPALLLGLGYSNRNLTIGIRYDVLYDDQKSIYANAWLPFVRVYF